MPNISGYAQGSKTRTYPGANDTQVPLLSSFRFGFWKEIIPDQLSDPKDNEIQSIQILPGGQFTDLSPNVTPIPTPIANDKIYLAYTDKTPTDINTDRYYYYVKHILKSKSEAKRFQIRAKGVKGRHTQQLPPRPPFQHGGDIFGSVFVLCGFKLIFTGGGDKRIDNIGIYVDAGNLIVEFNDKNDDDFFDYIIDYAWVSRAAQNVRLGEESGSGRPIFSEANYELKGEKLIRGFRFDFKQSDKQLHNIGISTSENGMFISFGDEDQVGVFDEFPAPNYDYMVQWATITPLVLV
jgi:hypothetical protein